MTFVGRETEALAVGDDAVARARRLGDPRALASVIDAALFSGWLTPARTEERLQLAQEGGPGWGPTTTTSVCACS